MNYSHELKVNWVTPIRTAARACTDIQKYYKFDVSGSHGTSIGNRREYQLIFNIRSPYTRLVSIYHLWQIHNPNNDSVQFEDWFKNYIDEMNSKIDYYTVFLDKVVKLLSKTPDFYVRLEFLESDLRNLWFIDNESTEFNNIIEKVVQTNIYKSSEVPWQSHYNQRVADLVYSKTEKQFELFNYNKNYWKDGTP